MDAITAKRSVMSGLLILKRLFIATLLQIITLFATSLYGNCYGQTLLQNTYNQCSGIRVKVYGVGGKSKFVQTITSAGRVVDWYIKSGNEPIFDTTEIPNRQEEIHNIEESDIAILSVVGEKKIMIIIQLNDKTAGLFTQGFVSFGDRE